MIVRVWKARAKSENAPAYRAHLESHVFPILRSLSGFLGADLMERADDGELELIVTSRWETLSAVRGFAGDTYENAVVAPIARKLLSAYDEDVSHYEVTAECKS
ncbi:MAG TPA: antibiotic biosynthesis monooxygenase [Vitreimonas sp.]|nr:antibiotic biosynthesis monooxygenase [Vitreimonas sp.]